jgi:aspartate aminotransferase-like enzyme
MIDISKGLKTAYNAEGVAVIPGGGTFGMEAIARQFATDKKCLVIRNGWFSYRWSQILEQGKISSETIVVKATRDKKNHSSEFSPASLENLLNTIKKQEPAVVFAPHVETSAGMLLPDSYIREVTEAVHSIGGIFVLDCVASGALWVDMKKTGVDVLLSAPQKGWSSTPCSGLVMLSENAKNKIKYTKSTSYVCDLLKWLQIMEAYENGGHAYHSTMPTDSLKQFRDSLIETEKYGFKKTRQEQIDLGKEIRSLLESRGFHSVAAEGFQSPSVVVSYTDNADIKSGKLFMEQGLQIAAGVPLECDEGDDFMTFRIGLFGLDKLHNLNRTVSKFKEALDVIKPSNK